MTTAWRIVKKRHAASAFDGEGARLYGGRWNSPGTSVVYVSESRALALVEVLAGVRSTRPLAAYVLIPAHFDDALVSTVRLAELHEDWRQSPPHPSTQRIGDAWVADQSSSVLRVPSAVIPDECNYVLNPRHPDFVRVEIGAPQELAVDRRLLG